MVARQLRHAGWTLFVGLTTLTALPSSAWCEEALPDEAKLLKARGMLALCGIVIIAIAMIAILRLFTHSIRRRWKRAPTASRMSPLQWQARRWRESQRKNSGAGESRDS